MNFLTLARRIALAALLIGGSTLLLPAPASAHDTACKKKKKKAHKAEAGVSASAADGKITSKTIKAWLTAGLSDDEIMERCNQAGYQPTKLGIDRMKKAKIRPSLIAALTGDEIAAPGPASPAPEPVAKKIDLGPMDPNDIDFDSVPPPAGTPAATRTSEKRPEPKKVETAAARPAPAPAYTAPAKPTMASSSDSGGAKPARVVYRPAG